MHFGLVTEVPSYGVLGCECSHPHTSKTGAPGAVSVGYGICFSFAHLEGTLLSNFHSHHKRLLWSVHTCVCWIMMWDIFLMMGRSLKKVFKKVLSATPSTRRDVFRNNGETEPANPRVQVWGKGFPWLSGGWERKTAQLSLQTLDSSPSCPRSALSTCGIVTTWNLGFSLMTF